MRPKKRILLIDGDEERLGLRRFLLTIWGFRVFSAAGVAEAREILAESAPDLLISCWPLPARKLNALMGRLRKLDPEARSLLLAENLDQSPLKVTADITLLRGLCSAGCVIERAKALCARRRGPKKRAAP